MLGPITGNGGVTIVPSDTVAQPGGPCRALYVGGAGNVTLVGLDGSVVTFNAVPVGTTLNVGFTRVNATGTAATLMTGIC